jgi:glycine/D-amino acid oxidase-like deaminating enzyme
MKEKEWSRELPASPESYWQSSVISPQYEQLTGDLNVDVAVIGGGITGITSAFLLKQSGLKVALLEASRILQGTTGHTTAKITAQHDIIYHIIKSKMGKEGAEQYAKANQAAISAIDTIIQQNNIECDFSWQPAYVYTQDENYIRQIEEEANAAFELGFAAVYSEEIPLPFPVKAALRFDNQAQFHPLKYLNALAAQIPGNGSFLLENTKAVDIQTQSGNIVTTSTGFQVKAPNIIIATHYPFYDGNGMYFCQNLSGTLLCVRHYHFGTFSCWNVHISRRACSFFSISANGPWKRIGYNRRRPS